MLNNKSITFYIKRLAMNNVYCSNAEIRTMVTELTPTEINLYTTLKDMALGKSGASELKNDMLAKRLEVSVKVLANTKSSLKKKGYAVINFSKDSDGDLLAQVYLGKDQVALYNLGVKVEIGDAKKYNELKHLLKLDDPKVTPEMRQILVDQFNEQSKD